MKDTKRLNLDVDDGLHAKFKAYCARKGVDMREEVVELISLVLEAKAEPSREEGEPVESGEREVSDDRGEDATTVFVIEGGKIVRKWSEEASDESEREQETEWKREWGSKQESVEPKVNEQKPAMSEKPITIYRCNRGNCRFATDDLDAFIDHKIEHKTKEKPSEEREEEEKPQRMQRTVAEYSACREGHLKSESAMLECPTSQETNTHTATGEKQLDDEENLCPKCGTKLVNALFPYCPKCWRGLGI